MGTIAVAFLAAFGDWAKSKWFAPKLIVRLADPKGDPVTASDGSSLLYFHLAIVNTGRSVATNCRIILRDVQRKDQHGQFHQVQNIPLQLAWTPATLGIYAQDIAKDAVVDFGFLKKGSDRFEPALLVMPFNFRGFVRAEESVRYGVDVDANNALSKKLHYFDVTWNGKWSDNADEMQRYLTVTPASPGT